MSELNDEGVFVATEVWQKRYANFTFEDKNRSGHSSQPCADDAIYELARAFTKLEAYKFPIVLNDVSRSSRASFG